MSGPEPEDASADAINSRGALLAQRQECQAAVRTWAAALEQLRQLRADGSDDDEHDPDGMPLSLQISRLEGLIRDEDARLSEIDHALGNLTQGRYGVCAECGAVIAPGRLAIRPAARTCVSCARLLP
ncbi:TraR/DksA family transcriptional regulator [Nakamurella antarctica]|nr:TraR/DksA C4-type zinc finger protein [Nakamurella antarctica]